MEPSWTTRYAEFTQTPLYLRYVEELNLEREEILMVGKKSRDPHILSTLAGFDQAASFFQRSVDKLREQNKTQLEETDNDSTPTY